MRLSLLCAVSSLALAYAGNADANSPKLKGEYAFTGTAACLFSPGSDPVATSNPTPGVMLPNAGFNSNLGRLPNSRAFSTSSSVEGIRTFNGDGTGTVRGTSVSITIPPTPGPTGYPNFAPGASSDTFSFQFTYIIHDDGTFTSQMVPGSYVGTFVAGGRTGQTYTLNQPPVTGIIGDNGKTLTLATVNPGVEVMTFSNGDVWPRICHRSRVLIKIQD